MDVNNLPFAMLTRLLQEEFGTDLLGILATGSRIHGTPGPTSDLDLQVIIARPQRQRRNWLIDELEIECFINPPAQIRRYFAEHLAGSIHMFSFGEIVYDPQGLVAELQAEARERWAAGPPALTAETIWRLRYLPADLLRDIEDLGDADPATTTLLLNQITTQLLEGHYQINRRWPVKAKRRLAILAGWDAQAATLVNQALDHQPWRERRAAVEQLVAHVLAPIGGLMPLEWRTEWEIGAG